MTAKNYHKNKLSITLSHEEHENPRDSRKYIAICDEFQNGDFEKLSIPALMYYYLNIEGLLHKNKLTNAEKEKVIETMAKRLKIAPRAMAFGVSDILNYIGKGAGNYNHINLTDETEKVLLNQILKNRPEEFTHMFTDAFIDSKKLSSSKIPPKYTITDDAQYLYQSSTFTHLWHQIIQKPGTIAAQGLGKEKGKFDTLDKTQLGNTFLFYRTTETSNFRNPSLYAVFGGIKERESLKNKIYDRILMAMEDSGYSSENNIPFDKEQFKNNLKVIDDLFRFTNMGYFLEPLHSSFQNAIIKSPHWNFLETTKKAHFVKYDITLRESGKTNYIKEFIPENFDVILYSVAGYVLDTIGDGEEAHFNHKQKRKRHLKEEMKKNHVLIKAKSNIEELFAKLKPYWPSFKSINYLVKK